MKYDKKYRSLFTKESLIKGTSICYLYWDTNAVGTYGDYVGGVRMEMVDIRKIAFSNPKIEDIQKQEWIIIKSRTSVKSLKNKLKDIKKTSLIKPDNEEQNLDGTQEVNENELCTTYLKFFKRDGEVYYTLTTKDVVIEENKPLNPKFYSLKNKKNDSENISTPNSDLVENNYESYSEVKFNRYPISILVLNESDDSIYGVSDIKDVINTQKYINHLYSMQLLNVQNTAWDKYLVKKGALLNQVITDEPGQIITDYYKNGDGIKRLGGMNAMANGTIDLANNAFQMIKTVSQTNDAFLGQSEKTLSGVANSLLQSQNEMPIDDMRKKLWAFEEDIGKTLELFMKLYYSNQEFYYELDDATILKNEMHNQLSMNNELPTNKFQTAIFNSNQFSNFKFHVIVEAMQGSRDSVIRLNNLMEALFINGAWGNMNVHSKKLFVEMYDMPDKDKFRALIEKEENDYIAQLENQIQQQQTYIQQQNAVLQRSQNTIDYLGKYNSSLQQSYKNEVSSHQKDINTLSRKIIESGSLKKEEELLK